MNVYSIGRLSQMFQRSPCQLRAAFEALGVEPALSINDINHFDDAAVEKLRRHFQFQKGNTMTKFEHYVADEMAASGSTRREAIAIVARKCPSAHAEYLRLTQTSATAARSVGRRAAPPAKVSGKGGAFLDLVAAEMQDTGCTRKTAIASVARRSPKLHAEFLKSTNDATNHETIDQMAEDR